MKKIVRLTEQDLVRLVNRVIKEQKDNSSFLDSNYVKELKQSGFKEVPKVELPDGTYMKGGGGYRIELYGSDKKHTGYVLVTRDGIRGIWQGQPIEIVNGTIAPEPYRGPIEVYKTLFNKDVVGQPLQ